MIEKVLEGIIAAEEEAKRITDKAEKDAKEISLASLAETENLKAEYALKIKERAKEILAKAEAEAAKLILEIDKKAAIEADALIKSCEKNLAKAINYVYGSLIKSTGGANG